jgi:hypothetical protein
MEFSCVLERSRAPRRHPDAVRDEKEAPSAVAADASQYIASGSKLIDLRQIEHRKRAF